MQKTKRELQAATARELSYWREGIAAGNVQVIISEEPGTGLTDYFRVLFVEIGTGAQFPVTWHLTQALGYALRDRRGRYYLAISGGGFSKPLDIAITLARFYGLEDYAVKFYTI
jgi:hypothetical protein